MAKAPQVVAVTRFRRRCQPVSDLPDPTDWVTLFNGQIYLCEEGIDYECGTLTFLTIVQDKARKMGVTLNVHLREDGKGIVVQVVL